jgi:parallel beta-helix repeat protein
LKLGERIQLLRVTVSGIILILLSMSMLTLAFNNKTVKAVSGTIYIRANGNVEGTTDIHRSDDNVTYVFVANINDFIVVQRSNIIIDGNGYTLQGPNHGNGIDITSINNVTIKDTNITNFGYGIYLSFSFNNTVSQNNASGSGIGIYLYFSSYNTLLDNNATSNSQKGIGLEGSSYNNVSGNSATGNSYGIWLESSSNNTISDNGATGNSNSDYGVYLRSSSNNNVSGNSANGNFYGIGLEFSSNNNNVSGNSVTGNTVGGIRLSSSSNNTIYGNNITNSYDGVWLAYSSKNTVYGNNITNNNEFGVYLESPDNTVCRNNITKNGYGVCLESTYNDFSLNNTVSGNDITNNLHGVYLWSSSNNTVCGNNIVANDNDGIWLHQSSSNNRVYGNNITKSNDGVYLVSSNNNVFCENNIMNNSLYGVALAYSNNNMIYHNNFVNNNFVNKTEPVYSSNSANVWNDTYPSGGNCWSGYAGVDEKSGPNQNQPGNDGIGDTPYTCDGNVTDGYPLMSPHNVAVTNVTSFKTVVGQGFCVNVSATVANCGTYDENLNLLVSANSTSITENATTLTVGNATVVIFAWNTSGYAYGNYSISACALPLPGEASFSGYNWTGCWVMLSIKGDLTGKTLEALDFVPDGKVDMKDVGVVAKFVGQKVLPAPSNCDVTGPTLGVPDGIIDMRDVGTVARHSGEHYP